MPAHGRAGARATSLLATHFAKQNTKSGGGGKRGRAKILRQRRICWKLLENSSAEARAEGEGEAGNTNFTNWLRDRDSNPNFLIQSQTSYP